METQGNQLNSYMFWTILKNLKEIITLLVTVIDLGVTVMRKIHKERDAAETNTHMKKVKAAVKEGKVEDLNKMWGFAEDKLKEDNEKTS